MTLNRLPVVHSLWPIPLACLASLARAQVGGDFPTSLKSYSLHLDQFLEDNQINHHTALCQQVVAGDFDGDERNDVAILTEGAVAVMLAPGTYDAGVSVASGTGLGLFPGPVRDHLLIAGTAGLQRWSWDPMTQSAPYFTATSVPNASNWTDVVKICTTSTAQGLWIYGLESDGQTLRWLVPMAGTWSAHSTTLPAAADDIEPIQWDGVGAPELAIIAQGNLEVRRLTGNNPLVHAYLLPGVHKSQLTTLDHDDGSSSTQWLAWLVTWDGADLDLDGEPDVINQALLTYGSGGHVDTTNLGSSYPIVHMVAADHDRDGSSDLFASYRDQPSILLFLNVGTADPEFSLATSPLNAYDTPPFSETTPGSQVLGGGYENFAVIDIDGDSDGGGEGDVDLVVPRTSEKRFWVYKDTRVVDQGDYLSDLGGYPGSAAPSAAYIAGSHPANGQFQEMILSYSFRHPAPNGITPEPGEQLYMEYSHFFQNSTVGGFDPTPDVERFLLLADPGSNTLALTPWGYNGDADGLGFSGIVFTTACIVSASSIDPSVAPSARYPSQILAAEGQSNDDSSDVHYQYIDGLQGPSSNIFGIGDSTVNPGDFEAIGKEVPCFPVSWNEPPQSQ